jgi:hypothetical protein
LALRAFATGLARPAGECPFTAIIFLRQRRDHLLFTAGERVQGIIMSCAGYGFGRWAAYEARLDVRRNIGIGIPSIRRQSPG